MAFKEGVAVTAKDAIAAVARAREEIRGDGWTDESLGVVGEEEEKRRLEELAQGAEIREILDSLGTRRLLEETRDNIWNCGGIAPLDCYEQRDGRRMRLYGWKLVTRWPRLLQGRTLECPLFEDPNRTCIKTVPPLIAEETAEFCVGAKVNAEGNNILAFQTGSLFWGYYASLAERSRHGYTVPEDFCEEGEILVIRGGAGSRPWMFRDEEGYFYGPEETSKILRLKAINVVCGAGYAKRWGFGGDPACLAAVRDFCSGEVREAVAKGVAKLPDGLANSYAL